MDTDKYQKSVLRTLPTGEANCAQNYSMGLAGESGEVVDIIKKNLYHGKPLDINKLMEELGDALFYLTAVCIFYGVSLEEVMEMNSLKLERRYPNGFNIEDAQRRADEQ